MKCASICLVALALQAGTASTVVSKSGESPVEKVVNLLKGLKSGIMEDGYKEGQLYNKTACWCHTISQKKATAVADMTTELRMLGQAMLRLKGEVAVLIAEIDELTGEIKSNKESQEEASSLRKEQNAAWQAETKEMKEAISALQEAMHVLIEGSGGKMESFLQRPVESATAVRKMLKKMPTVKGLKTEKISLLMKFAREQYQPQSQTIQGILGEMYATMAANVESATQQEAMQNKDFENFIAAKQTAVNQMEKTISDKDKKKSETEAELADATQSFEDVTEERADDYKFFDETVKHCNDAYAEYQTRKTLRAEELGGVNKALEILTSDEARDLFASAIKPGKETGQAGAEQEWAVAPAPGIPASTVGFLQVDSEETAGTTMRAFSMLKKMASKAHSLRLAQLAASVRQTKAGHFDKVLGAINDMIGDLKDEEADDIAKRDQCKEEYQNIKVQVKDLSWKIKKNGAQIDKLESTIEKDTENRDKTVKKITGLLNQIAAMDAARVNENSEFLAAKNEDAAAIELLTMARDALTAYYDNNDIDMGPIQGNVQLLQKGGPDFAVSEEQAPDMKLKGKGSSATASKGIVQMMTYLIEDLNDEIMNGMKNEATDQKDFENANATATDLLEKLSEKKTNLEASMAARAEEQADEELVMKQNKAELGDEKKYHRQIKPDCDWIIGAFTERADKRAMEMNGLTTAKEFLSGAKPAAFIQMKPQFDDNAFSRIGFQSLGQ